MVSLISLGILSACVDYSYEYNFSVVGDHGTVSTGWWDNTASKWHDEPSPLILRGGKSGSHQLKLVAAPADGYQVKEWDIQRQVS